MEVYLLRHGIAQDRDPKKYPDDRLRPLTIEGTERMREVVRGMLKLGMEFDAVFDSGFTRARQTTEIVTDAYRIDSADITTTPALEPDRDPVEVFALLESHKADRRVLMVGHEPHLSLTLAFLTGGRDGNAFDFKKGALARVDLSSLKPRSGMLVYLLPPKVLRKIR
jgi:phosphohistidine phosphatase SixA